MKSIGAVAALDDIFVSASQTSAYEACKRKWALRTVAKIETEKGKALLLGTEVDDTQLQPYLRDGREFDFGRDSGYIAASALAFLPEPKSGFEIQQKFILPSPSWEDVPGGFSYLGYKDLFAPAGVHLPGVKGDVPCVTDFKTTSDFQWAKTEKTLRTDTQAVIYAMDTLFQTGASAVDLNWIYMRTRGANAAKQVLVRMTEDEVVEQFERIDVVALEIAKQRREVERLGFGEQEERIRWVLDVLPPTPSACGDFGGCEFKHICNLSPAQKNAHLFKGGARKGDGMGIDLMANLRKKKSAAGINPPEKDLPPAPAVGVTPPVELPTTSAPTPAVVTSSTETEAPVKRTRAKKQPPVQVVENPVETVVTVPAVSASEDAPAIKTTPRTVATYPAALDSLEASVTIGRVTYTVRSAIPAGVTRIQALTSLKTDMLVVFDKEAA